jgi:hypothetical protein
MLDSPDCHKEGSKERMTTSHRNEYREWIAALNIDPRMDLRQKKQRPIAHHNVTLKTGPMAAE